MDAWGHHIARRRAADIEAVLRQSFADDVTIGDHADQPVVLANGNGAYVMLTHQFCEFGHRRVWTDPVDSLVHCVFDFHGRPPLLKFAYQPWFPSPFEDTTDRFIWHGLQHRCTQDFFLSRSGTIAEPKRYLPLSRQRIGAVQLVTTGAVAQIEI
jgi:hypothetical protein